MWIFICYKHAQYILPGRNRSVGIATLYGLDDPVIKPDVGELFRTRSDRQCGTTQSPMQWVPVLSRG